MNSKSGNVYPIAPGVGVGVITIKDEKVLLVKRGAEPGKELWAIPGGTLKLGETMQECAAREILEETGITIKVRDCIYVFDFIERDSKRKIKYHYVIVDFSADYVAGEPRGADDALDAGWFSRKDLRELPVAINTINALKSAGFLK